MNIFKVKFLIFATFVSILMSNKVNAKYIFVSNENSDTVTVLNSADKKIIKTIKTGGRPRDIKISNDKSKIYVVVSEENHIVEIDISNLEIVNYIESGDDPEIFDISPDGHILAVSNEDDNELTIIDIKNRKKIAIIENVGVEPEGVNFSLDGKYIFVTSEGTNSVIVIDVKQKKIINEILVGNRPRRGILTKNGEEYWVSNELNGSVTIISTKTFDILRNIKFTIKGIRDQNITPVDFAYSEKNNKVYVTLGSANYVAVINSLNYKIENYILAGSRVWGAALTKNEKQLIVTNGNSDDISIIDLQKNITISSIPVGKTPHTVRVIK
ncbi:MAG: hypothetical protein CMP36_03620 [Rickettsiales bacterium]|nr:hypothetical protein [Rickettsiales bacterium]OUV78986.1 MAG: hypothetical protein CBC91_04390 [Rickettsiales bacterium TMED131]